MRPAARPTCCRPCCCPTTAGPSPDWPAGAWESPARAWESPARASESPGRAWECPACYAEACVKTDTSSAGYVCLSCGEDGNYSSCERCGELFHPGPYDDEGNGSWICDKCERQAMESD